MTVKEMQEKILQLKKEKDICILAHSYVAREIIEIADYTGDSFQLSVLAEKTDAKTVIMCGVRFMAETVKILSPEKTVYITSPVAGCPMAEQMSVILIQIRGNLAHRIFPKTVSPFHGRFSICAGKMASSSLS